LKRKKHQQQFISNFEDTDGVCPGEFNDIVQQRGHQHGG